MSAVPLTATEVRTSLVVRFVPTPDLEPSIAAIYRRKSYS